MNILKRVLSGSFRLAFFGALKAALFAYMLFLPDAAYVSSGPESGGHVNHTASFGATGGSRNVGIG
jgi:hypothetical protein